MRQGLIAFLLLGLAACTPSAIRTVTQPKPIAQSSGNGDSYSGKTFVFKGANSTCAVESAIVYNFDGEFLLTRQGCEDLNPAVELSAAQVSLDFQNSRLTYSGETYINEFNPSCNYAEFTGNVSSGGECTATDAVNAVVSQNLVSGGVRYEFAMYNASSSTSDFYNRYITYQKVQISAGLGANSVDLVLSSYEPVRWEFTGNTAAIRSVHIRGYHCATYTGVNPALVSISTYEQGDSANVRTLPLSLNISASTSAYEGSCLPNRTLVIQ